MPMHRSRLTARVFRIATIALLGTLLPFANAFAHATAQTPSISGNWPVALAIVLAAIAALILLVRGALHLDERDAWLRKGGEGNDYWMRD
jgi:uncharacterized membrane protein YjfL (UPF0719 family)